MASSVLGGGTSRIAPYVPCPDLPVPSLPPDLEDRRLGDRLTWRLVGVMGVVSLSGNCGLVSLTPEFDPRLGLPLPKAAPLASAISTVAVTGLPSREALRKRR